MIGVMMWMVMGRTLGFMILLARRAVISMRATGRLQRDRTGMWRAGGSAGGDARLGSLSGAEDLKAHDSCQTGQHQQQERDGRRCAARLIPSQATLGRARLMTVGPVNHRRLVRRSRRHRRIGGVTH